MTLLQPAHAFLHEAVLPLGETVDEEVEALPSPGSARWLRLTRALSRADEAERTISELRLRVAQLEAQLYSDDQTGLYNRRALLAELEREIGQAGAAPGDGGLALVLDLDDLHLLNARMGAAAGDAFLLRSAQALCAAARPTDIVARIGGDEFCVLLTRVDKAPGIRLAQDLIRRFEAAELTIEGEKIPLRATFGWCHYGAGDDAASVLAAADLAMVVAKRGG
ncbi:GGDEF domain-containing protein [Arenibaculum pallidiluteum]|uniref:GGDEF domain-containing protein n=1 Tax=Arenibaculum pallidiluteum TaxID=2812559 RepID=UPI001A975AF2|nr:GGDEF domain-containing protein [Arenibaculum pallidiluteum]